jgi:hypothetical protein
VTRYWFWVRTSSLAANISLLLYSIVVVVVVVVVECDGLAKAYWNECMKNNSWLPINKGFADEGWSVWIEGKKLTKMDKQALYHYCFSKRTKAYWSKKHHLTAELITNINWDACQQALNKLPFGKRRWLLKHATGFCGVGKMEEMRGNQDHAECPSCGQFEDAIHVARDAKRHRYRCGF